MTENQTIKIEFSYQLNSIISTPKFYLGQSVIVEPLEGIDDDDYLITGITLSYSEDSKPYWKYSVGIKELSHPNFDFKDNWFDEESLKS